MQKIKLLIAESGLSTPWLMPLWQEYFDVEKYDHDQTYDQSSIVLTDNRFGLEPQRYQQIKSHGYRIILTYLTDSNVNTTCETVNGEFVLRARDWMWIQESIQWRHQNYHVPRAPSVPSKFFLLLMNLQRPSRDQLRLVMTPYLDSSLHSYVAKGIYLPGDKFVASPFHNGIANDRFYNPDWYTQTCFSLVSETFTSSKLFISEKIFKPMAYQHPLVVYGTPKTLEYIHSLGFETFGHRINESYDSEIDRITRLYKIVAVIDDLYQEFTHTGTVFQDSTTQEILAHNHARFFDQTLMHKLFKTQVVEPILEYVESQ